MCIYVGTIYTYVYIVYLCIYIEKCGPLLILSLHIEPSLQIRYCYVMNLVLFTLVNG